MKQKVLDLLACPKCKGALEYDKKQQELICTLDQIHYPIKDGIPELVIKDVSSKTSCQ